MLKKTITIELVALIGLAAACAAETELLEDYGDLAAFTSDCPSGQYPSWDYAALCEHNHQPSAYITNCSIGQGVGTSCYHSESDSYVWREGNIVKVRLTNACQPGQIKLVDAKITGKTWQCGYGTTATYCNGAAVTAADVASAQHSRYIEFSAQVEGSPRIVNPSNDFWLRFPENASSSTHTLSFEPTEALPHFVVNSIQAITYCTKPGQDFVTGNMRTLENAAVGAAPAAAGGGAVPANLGAVTGPGAAYVAANGNNLNLRSGPGQGFNVIAVMPDGAMVNVISLNGSWAQLSYGSYTGWAASWLLAQASAPAAATTESSATDSSSSEPATAPATPQPPPPSTAPTTGQLYVSYNLNMRGGPNENYAVLTTIYGNSYVTGLGEVQQDAQQREWLKISYNGTVGWVAKWVIDEWN